MVRYFLYALSGKGIIPDKSWALIILLKKAGVVFSFHPKFSNTNGQLLFSPVQEIDEKTKQRALILLQGEGVAGAEIEARGSYAKW